MPLFWSKSLYTRFVLLLNMKTTTPTTEGQEDIDTTEISQKFNDISYVNKILKYYADQGIHLQIKTCKYKTKTGRKKYNERVGMFKLESDKHQELVHNNGYYLFIVRYDNETIKHWKIIKAQDLYFQTSLMWPRVIGD